MMETYFALPGRSDRAELQREIATVDRSPIVGALLHSVSGMLAVLNHNRQVLALNDELLQELGVVEPEEALGLRPGEALDCVHAGDGPDGCGTTKYCSTCGAAIAIVSSLGYDGVAERVCALAALRDGKSIDVCLLVRASPIRIGGEKFLLLFLRDITVEWNRAALERAFFHDVNNMLGGLISASSLLSSGNLDPELVRIIHQSASRMAREVSIQACLREGGDCAFNMVLEETTATTVLKELSDLFSRHPAAEGRSIRVRESTSDRAFETDVSLLLRVLSNMMTNALEATSPGGQVEVWADESAGRIEFCVWNEHHIDPAVALRVFQRNFSTKNGDGRGLGTYSMKLLGEQYLGGEVRFSSAKEDGTVFCISLPG